MYYRNDPIEYSLPPLVGSSLICLTDVYKKRVITYKKIVPE